MLAAGALCIALKANPDNGLVKFCIDTADKLDFGVFSRTDGVAHWKGQSHAALTKNALVNWGLAAVVWLIIGQIVASIIRPDAPVALPEIPPKSHGARRGTLAFAGAV